MDPLITTQIKGVLENSIFNKINALNLNIPNATLRAIVSRVAEETSSSVVKGVGTTANFQLTDIPKNLIGGINPVDIVTGNQGPAGLTNNLDGILQTQLSGQLTDKVVTAIQNQLRINLPKDKFNIINFDNLSSNLVQSLTPTIGKSITTALGGFADAVFSRGKTPPLTISNIDSYFAAGTSDQAMTNVDEAFTSVTADLALEESRKFSIDTVENNEKLAVLEKGFQDPGATYPTKEYSGMSETNKLAQGDVRGTIVQKKNQARMIGAKLPFGEAWDQPESAFRGAYPYNKVTETESGHVIEVDDTPGSERLHIYHRSGTFIEIDANGSVVKRAVGSSYEIIDKNGKIAISGKADISVNGECNIFVGNDANIEVEGDVNLTCHNDITAQAGGTLNLSATEEVNITGANVNVQAYEVLNMTSNTALNLHATENINMLANTSIYVQAVSVYQNTTTAYNQADNFYNYANESIFTQAEQDINIKAAGDLKNQAAGVISNQAGGVFAADGSAVHMNSGQSVEAEDSLTSEPAAIAGISNIGILSGRKDISYIDISDPQAMTLADNKSLLLEEQTQTSQDFTDQKNLIISGGYATAADIDKGPVAVESTSVQSTQGTTVAQDENLKKATQLPGNYNISPNFTIEMLSNKAAVTRDTIQAQAGLTYGEIVYNLQGLALNVLEPVKKLYPNMFVTSAFRFPGNNATSQHPKGLAADIQFKGATKKEYYEIAQQIAKVLRYDQFLLEYCNYTNNPWIHISYTPTNRLQVLTFFNHKTHSQGLTQLA